MTTKIKYLIAVLIYHLWLKLISAIAAS